MKHFQHHKIPLTHHDLCRIAFLTVVMSFFFQYLECSVDGRSIDGRSIDGWSVAAVVGPLMVGPLVGP